MQLHDIDDRYFDISPTAEGFRWWFLRHAFESLFHLRLFSGYRGFQSTDVDRQMHRGHDSCTARRWEVWAQMKMVIATGYPPMMSCFSIALATYATGSSASHGCRLLAVLSIGGFMLMTCRWLIWASRNFSPPQGPILGNAKPRSAIEDDFDHVICSLMKNSITLIAFWFAPLQLYAQCSDFHFPSQFLILSLSLQSFSRAARRRWAAILMFSRFRPRTADSWVDDARYGIPADRIGYYYVKRFHARTASFQPPAAKILILKARSRHLFLYMAATAAEMFIWAVFICRDKITPLFHRSITIRIRDLFLAMREPNARP